MIPDCKNKLRAKAERRLKLLSPANNTKLDGFTLIEISIVLVILGLIIGGVLIGRVLVKAAEIRSSISQIEQYRTAANTFKLKYNCLPEDCLQSQASAFGLYNTLLIAAAGLFACFVKE